MPDVLEARRESGKAPPDVCGAVDRCAHVGVEQCQLTTRHRARPKAAQTAAERKTVPHNSNAWRRPRARKRHTFSSASEAHVAAGETFSTCATQWCWRSCREPTHVGGSSRPCRGRATQRPDRENFLRESGPRCCNLPHSDARVPTSNQRSRRGIVPHRWCWRYQTDDYTVVNFHKVAPEEHAAFKEATSEEQRTEKEPQPEVPLVERRRSEEAPSDCRATHNGGGRP